MIADLKPYPAMKDSGVPWLGEVPEHWDVRRLKQICRLAYGDALATDVREQGSVPVYGSNGRVGFHSSANTKFPCIVIGRKGSFGKVNFSAEPAFAIDTTFFVDDRFSAANLRWLFYLLGWLRLDDVSKDSAVPGLDPNVRLKPSGVEWLGDVPEHWEVLPVKRCSAVISKGTTPSTEGRNILETGLIRFFKAENISISGNGIVDHPRAFIDQETHNILHRSQLHEDDVLFVIAGATLGKIGIVRANHLPANTNQAVAFIRPNRRVIPKFLAIWLQSSRIKEQIWLNAVQSAQPNLSMESLGNFPMPFPSVEEQAVVVQRLKAELSIPNTTIARIGREISLLREYRTRLIADVVTGKLDVREAAACLPEETDEPEPLDDAEALAEVEDLTDVAPEEAEA